MSGHGVEDLQGKVLPDVVIVGAEDEEHCLTVDDIDSTLVLMYTPVTEEGAKGEPQYKYTDFVKATPPPVSNIQIIGCC